MSTRTTNNGERTAESDNGIGQRTTDDEGYHVRRIVKRHAPLLLLFAVLAVAMTWPLARNLPSAVANTGDPLINTWILDWDWHATIHHPASLFQADAFYPAQD